MGALLSGPAREVLRALVHGLELREVEGEWTFIGHWQEPSRSGVLLSVMHELFGSGFISRGVGSRAVITEAGEAALFRSTKEAIDVAFKWLNETP